VQAQAASDELKADLVLTQISGLDARAEECGKDIEREAKSVHPFVIGTFDENDDFHQAAEQFTRGSCRAAKKLGLGLTQSLKAAGLME
jgi:hypothetical protein